jgi:hypothetical protein
MQKGIPLNYIKIKFSLLVTTLYFMSSMQWKMDFVLKTILINKSHLNVFLFSTGHHSKDNYVAIQFSPL